ncbi:MAG: hypothetical protein LBS19_05905 [Clostridiales bacterium]|jgi:hypothetical protein|nr:hypothetical protein [Clostridiales bacterium]
MTGNLKPSRPADSRHVKVTPEFRERPDIEKLARALISIARHLAEQKKAKETATRLNCGKGDTVP